ncbi:small conductance mechanosensitive channel [Ligilactobacillus sp. WC1T17]|uniref:Small conductance mechanosensitive channel n=1 Tax=Ligilactobacillus ruminis TaxID=1623 RepID=A0ABY1AE66_9LACO|nr:small conductance mechanosensitive channel [Ligilactobacillus ruminis]
MLAAVKGQNIIQKYFTNYNWDQMISTFLSTLFSLAVVSLLFFVIHTVGKKIIKKSFHTARKNTADLALGRINTIYTLSMNIFHYAVLFFYFYAVLSILGVPVSTLLASAGIVSVALGLGAQGLVSDIVTGFFILLEQQFVVGDDVKIGTIEGTVSAIGLRNTQITGYDGTLHFIPNRSITIVSNMSRNDMRVLVDIRLDSNKDLEKMKQIVASVNQELTPKLSDLTKQPQILGTVDLGSGDLVLRVIAYAKNGAQYAISRQLRDSYLDALKDHGFDIPTSPLSLTK